MGETGKASEVGNDEVEENDERGGNVGLEDNVVNDVWFGSVIGSGKS